LINDVFALVFSDTNKKTRGTNGSFGLGEW